MIPDIEHQLEVVALLGKQVCVYLGDDEGGNQVIVTGKLLSFGDMGEFVVEDGMGDIIRAWPMLTIEGVGFDFGLDDIPVSPAVSENEEETMELYEVSNSFTNYMGLQQTVEVTVRKRALSPFLALGLATVEDFYEFVANGWTDEHDYAVNVVAE